MIHIIDNGAAYSSHEIYFCESPLSPEEVDRVLGAFPPRSYAAEPTRLASADSFSWRDRAASMSLLDAPGGMLWDQPSDSIQAAEALVAKALKR